MNGAFQIASWGFYLTIPLTVVPRAASEQGVTLRTDGELCPPARTVWACPACWDGIQARITPLQQTGVDNLDTPRLGSF